MYVFGTIGAVTSFFFTLDGFRNGRGDFYIISLIGLFIITFGNLLYFAIKKNTNFSSNLLIFSFFCFCLILFAFIGVDYSAILWYFICSPLAILLTNIKKGLIYNAVLFGVTLLLIWNPMDLAVNEYPDGLILRFVIAYPTLNAFILVFEYSRMRSFQAYTDTLNEVNTKNLELTTAKEHLNETNQELTKLNKTKDKFFSIIAHDLRGPFTSIIGLSSLLVQDDQINEPAKRKELIGYIQNSSKAAYNLMENLLAWALSQSESIEYNPIDTDLEDMIDEVRLLTEGAIKGKEITFLSEVEAGQRVFVDRNMMKTVISNLVFNATKFTGRGGSICLSTSTSMEPGFLLLEIKDNGIGMSQSQLDKLFIISVNNSTEGTENEKGSGLGLMICKEFVERHGGEISVESKEGEGASFIVSIPVSPAV